MLLVFGFSVVVSISVREFIWESESKNSQLLQVGNFWSMNANTNAKTNEKTNTVFQVTLLVIGIDR